ncbi:hypothetical protein OSTOST_05051 [Ostertagia ostertagi]
MEFIQQIQATPIGEDIRLESSSVPMILSFKIRSRPKEEAFYEDRYCKVTAKNIFVNGIISRVEVRLGYH